MANLYWDPNSVRRRSKNLKYYINSQERIEKEMERIQERLNNLDWTDESRIERRRLYEQLGDLMDRYRTNRIIINYNHEKLIEKANITG